MNKTNWRYGNHHINILGISLIALGATLFVPNRVLAQWRVGASGGATFNHYSIDTQYQTDYRYGGAWGWSAAITGQYDFFDWMGLHIELKASERNYRFYRTGVFSGIDYICHNTYLQLPVMARFSFGGKKVRGFLNAGVYGGYWLAGRYKGTVYNRISQETEPLDVAYEFQNEKDRRWDIGMAGGVGIEYLFHENWAMSLEGRCYYSLISTTKQYMLVKDYRYFSVEGTPTSQYDLLVAKTTTSRKACGGTVPLSFIHACAAVWFNIGQSSTLNGKSITFTEIALTGIYNSGDYHFNTGTWTVLAGSASFSLEKASNIDISVSSTSGEDARALRCGHLFMIPQTLGTGAKLVITYSGGTQTTAEIPLNGKT